MWGGRGGEGSREWLERRGHGMGMAVDAELASVRQCCLILTLCYFILFNALPYLALNMYMYVITLLVT